jgi:hypothetical protein
MELTDNLGRTLLETHRSEIQFRQQQREEERRLQKDREEREAQTGPYRALHTLVQKAMARCDTFHNQPRLGSKEVDYQYTFPLNDTTVEGKTIKMRLKVAWVDDADMSNTSRDLRTAKSSVELPDYSLYILLEHEEGEETEHYLANLQVPVVASDGLPCKGDYGLYRYDESERRATLLKGEELRFVATAINEATSVN